MMAEQQGLPVVLGNPRGLGAPAGPKGFAPGERERWLEVEVERLRLEAERLEDVNEVMRTEIFFKDSTPALAKNKMSQWFKDQLDIGEAGTPAHNAALRIKRQASEITADGPLQGSIMATRLAKSADDIEDDMEDALERQQSKFSRNLLLGRLRSGRLSDGLSSMKSRGSELAHSPHVQGMIYLLALGFAVFVMLATALHWGAPHHDGHGTPDHDEHGVLEHDTLDHEGHEGHGRRLGGGVSPLMKNLAFTVTMAGLVSLLIHFFKQQLILGYLLAGVLVGPLGLNIVESPLAISDLSSLGLIFLLFMIGLELDFKQALRMGKEACITGVLQLPICAFVMTPLFLGLEAAGLHFGNGRYSAVYCGITAGLSSTMIVVKWLDHKGQLDGQSGKFTVGILMFQDFWALVLLAAQTNLSNPTVGGFAQSFGMMALLVFVALAYAKFVMPAVMFYASKSVELMLVMSLAWCFFICCAAILPFVGLPMEMAALIAGISLATFPYSTEFNAKIKYIRDFFFTLFFAGMGMMLPVPRAVHFVCAIVIAVVVLLVRPLGIFLPARCLGKTSRVAAYATINLSQLSEFTLVICSLGVVNGHVDEETLEIVIMAFAILAVVASYSLDYKHFVYSKLAWLVHERLLGCTNGVAEEEDGDDEDREILLLGFHKVAFLLIDEVRAKSPGLLSRFHVIDVNTNIMPQLREMGIKCTYGDIASSKVMKHARKGMTEPRVVISTIPDTLLQGTNNLGLVETVKEVFSGAYVIAIADDPHTSKRLYAAGASYVVRMAKLSAERLLSVLQEHDRAAHRGGGILDMIKRLKAEDNANPRGRFTATSIEF